MRRGFTLVETVFAGAIAMLVCAVLAGAAGVFAGGQRSVASRRSALLVALAEMDEAAGLAPVEGSTGGSVDFAGSRFDVLVSTAPDSAGTFRLMVTVEGPSGGPVTLERRFIAPGGSI